MESIKEKNVLINRTQMLQIARGFNVFVSQGTIHRWANEPDFPLVAGKKGKYLLYSKIDFDRFILRKLRRIQSTH